MADTKTVTVNEPETAKKGPGKRATKPKATKSEDVKVVDDVKIVEVDTAGKGAKNKKEAKVETAEEEVKQVDGDAEVKKPKKKKRFWQLTDENGQPLDGDTKTRLHGSSPYQAALKAVTRFAEEQDKEHTFYLHEIMPRKGGPSKKLYVYKGWKSPLKENEESVFTQKYNIKTKPHAKSQGVMAIKETEVEKV